MPDILEFIYRHSENFAEHLRKGGWRGGRWWLLKQYHRNKPGTISGDNVFEYDWDLLVVLDGCDPAWIRDVAVDTPLYDIPEVTEITSVGTSSYDWHEHTFESITSEQARQTAVISANPFTNRISQPVGLLEDVKAYGWEERLGITPAHQVTDAAIRAGRETDYTRYLVHYMQPHAPFLNRVTPSDRTPVELAYGATNCWQVWYDAMRGELTQKELRDYYVSNLRYVLNEVELLCENFDADRAFVSSDHGNAVGQGGMYGHPGRAKIEWLRKVPWVPIDATDQRTVEPELDRDTATLSRDEQLEALGYR